MTIETTNPNNGTPTERRAARLVFCFLRGYGHTEAGVFASFLRAKRRRMSHQNRIAWAHAYNTVKGDRFPESYAKLPESFAGVVIR